MTDAEEYFGKDSQNISLLVPQLQDYLEPVRHFGICLRSPWVFQVPFYSWKLANEMYYAKLTTIEKELAIGNFIAATWYYERPFRMIKLNEWLTKQIIPHDNFKELLPLVWKDAEFPNQYDNLPLKLFEIAGFLTDNEEKWQEIKSQEKIIIYRGIHRKGDKTGISWTLNREKALWFANRFSPKHSYLCSGKVLTSNVLAYFADRGEDEIVVNFNSIENIRIR